MKVVLVDDHPMIRTGLASILSYEEEISEIKEASNVREAVDVICMHNPDIAIVDLRLGKEDGLEIVGLVKEKNLQTKFIILTSSMKKDDFMRAQDAGVDGYVLKDAFTEDILYAFRVVSRGKRFFSPDILEYTKSNEDELKDLTPRERDVLIELSKGHSNMQIAQHLYISENTVKKHISSILGKLGLNHRLEAAVFVNNSINLMQ